MLIYFLSFWCIVKVKILIIKMDSFQRRKTSTKHQLNAPLIGSLDRVARRSRKLSNVGPGHYLDGSGWLLGWEVSLVSPLYHIILTVTKFPNKFKTDFLSDNWYSLTVLSPHDSVLYVWCVSAHVWMLHWNRLEAEFLCHTSMFHWSS